MPDDGLVSDKTGQARKHLEQLGRIP
jgi:hypothetical protein